MTTLTEPSGQCNNAVRKPKRRRSVARLAVSAMVTLVALTSVTVAAATLGSAEPVPGTTATVPVGTNPNAIAIYKVGTPAKVGGSKA